MKNKNLLHKTIKLFLKTEENLNLTDTDIKKIINGETEEYNDFLVNVLFEFDLLENIPTDFRTSKDLSITGLLVYGQGNIINKVNINENITNMQEIKDLLIKNIKDFSTIDYIVVSIDIYSNDNKYLKPYGLQTLYFNFKKLPIDENEYIKNIGKILETDTNIKAFFKGMNISVLLQKVFICKNINNIELDDIFLAKNSKGIDVKIFGFKNQPKQKIISGQKIFYIADVIKLYDYIKGIYDVVNETLNKDINIILEKNVRTYIPFDINEPAKAIVRTLFSYNENKYFFLYNNGITSIASSSYTDFDGDADKFIIKFKDFNVINGGQTTTTLYHLYSLLILLKEKKDISNNNILNYIFFFYFEKMENELKSSLIKKENILNLIKDYVLFLKEYLFGIDNLSKEDYQIIEETYKKILQTDFEKNDNLISLFKNEIVNKFFIEKFLNIYGNELYNNLLNNLKTNDILFKCFIGLSNHSLINVAKYSNLQNQVSKKELLANYPEIKILNKYLKKNYNMNDFNGKIKTNIDLLGLSTFIYLSTIDKNEGGILGEKESGPSFLKNNIGKLDFEGKIYDKILGFNVDNNDIEKRIFYYLIEKYLLKTNLKEIIKILNLDNNFIKEIDNLFILFILILLLKKDNIIDKIDLEETIKKILKNKNNIKKILEIDLLKGKNIGNLIEEAILIFKKLLDQNNTNNIDQEILKYFGYQNLNMIETNSKKDVSWEDYF